MLQIKTVFWYKLQKYVMLRNLDNNGIAIVHVFVTESPCIPYVRAYVGAHVTNADIKFCKTRQMCK